MMLIFPCRCLYWEPYGSIYFLLLGVLEGEGCIIGALFTVGFCFVFTFVSIYYKVLSNDERKYLSVVNFMGFFVCFFVFFFSFSFSF